MIVSAFAAVTDIRLSLTPQLQYDSEVGRGVPADPGSSGLSKAGYKQSIGDTVLLLIDLGRGKNRLGGSILAQVVSQMGEATPDVDNPTDLKNFWKAIQQLGRMKKLLAYHDRSDGGLLATVAEMAFAGHTGVDLEIPHLHDPFSALFNEELGAVIQVRESDFDDVYLVLRENGLKACVSRIGTLNSTNAFGSPRATRSSSRRISSICARSGPMSPVAFRACATIPNVQSKSINLSSIPTIPASRQRSRLTILN